ncbi:hypothetical protein CC80DRAFT_588607 [Byssothecium circinans]|uniref:CYTH domain-containing protein n=1 Tax=Byssothecium circinans TaxID=147558 RepID=A0A6A5UJP9_9PLEO|nr:hypothetical protein CC80DRAFT_588607 [Byssothecium circinans]
MTPARFLKNVPGPRSHLRSRARATARDSELNAKPPRYASSARRQARKPPSNVSDPLPRPRGGIHHESESGVKAAGTGLHVNLSSCPSTTETQGNKPPISVFDSLPRGGIHLLQRAAQESGIRNSLKLAARSLSPHTSVPVPYPLQPAAPTRTGFNLASRHLSLRPYTSTPHPPPPPPNRSRTLEIERKFAPTPSSLALLRTNSSTPAFTRHEYLGSRSIRDEYFDHASGALMRRGVYLRSRDGVWEVKVRRGGGYVDSCFEESREEGRVWGVVGEVLREEGVREEVDDGGKGKGDDGRTSERWECGCVADIRTVRESWDVDGFRVVVDRMGFGHVVGEVEVEVEVEVGGDGDGNEAEDVEKVMQGRIERFMGEHPDVFPRGGVEGKLSAYFRMEKERRRKEMGGQIDWNGGEG